MFAPSEKTVAIVREWLVSSGISAERITHSDNQGWLAFDATTEETEALLHAEYHEYEHAPTGNVAAACDVYVQHLFPFFLTICEGFVSQSFLYVENSLLERENREPCL
jgi:hypothetical protein